MRKKFSIRVILMLQKVLEIHCLMEEKEEKYV